MPNSTRQVATHTWLAMVAVLLIVMGAINGLMAWQLPVQWRPPLASLPFMVLAGGGLLATLLARPHWARLCGGVLLMLALVPLVARLPAPLDTAVQGWPFPVGLLISLLVAALALCLIAGVHSPLARLGWMLTGCALMIVSAGNLLDEMWTGIRLPALWAEAFSTAFTALPSLLLGSALLLIGRGLAELPTAIHRPVLMPLTASLSASVLVWFTLTWQQYEARLTQAGELLSSFKVSAEREIDEHQRLLQRMADRWGELGGLPDSGFRDLEFASYFRDIPSLVSLHWQDANESLLWGRDRGSAFAVSHWLDRPDHWLFDWLAVGGPYPRWILPDESRPQLALVAVPLPWEEGPSGQLVAVIDLTRLLRMEVRSFVSPLVVTVHRGEQPVLLDANAHGAPGAELQKGLLVLPGGATLEARGHAPLGESPTLAGMLPVGVGLGGLILSYLMAFSLGVAHISARRSVTLANTQRHLRAQQRVQTMVARDQPLAATLEAICRLVEAQAPGALSSIMLSNREGQCLDEVYSVSLPESYLAAVQGVPIAPNVGACGSAAYLRDFVICEDIAHDHRWRGFHAITAEHGLRACWSYPVLGSSGQLLGTFATYYRQTAVPSQDDRRRIIEAADLVSLAVERERNREALLILQRSVEASINGVTIADMRLPGMPLIYVNEAFERITGYTREETLGRNCRFLQGGETDAQAVDELRQALVECREASVTLLNYRKDGTPFWNNLFLAPVRDAAGAVSHFVGIQQDISQHKAFEAKLAYHSSHDALTGLANRSLFEDHLNHDVMLARRQGSRLAVLFIDLDDFKPINDSLGHEVGDQVLIQVAKRVADELDPGDTLARFGSDEFVILLPGIRQEDDAFNLAERLLKRIGRSYRVGQHELYLGASVGVAFLSRDIDNPVELIQQADMAMYRAKQKGRNVWQCFTGEINDEVSTRMALRNDLQEAIDAGNFELHYQPLIDATDGGVAGFEALVRWKHPVRGYLSPGLFIPLAEETGQIVPISEWVLRQACRDMCELARDGLGHFRVAVNLSPLQFHRPNFLGNLKQALLETGLAAEYLELELTEGILMNDTASAIETLRLLREMGVEVAIDDFGTGFSSLSYLKLLPIGKIKIDRSFVRDVTRSAHDSAIVQGIISMAHHLGLTVVAEGIEEAAQASYLKQHGCDIFQGFHFARPMPLAQLRAYLVDHDTAPRAKGAAAPADR
ncbi:EAL domain-containing protein [Halomonas sp. NO4]|uniref:putative bifunctional diguanylate cyclase/phosphodiesterase n=1 Tax=Halomonas sp. NO4 TaxID=2484813 RepID=UPI0013D45F0E|nr:EAL domain-containing protein [Halomonas sp. NO4]